MNKKNLTQKFIISLLTLQMVLLGIQAKNRIQQGDSLIEIPIWMFGNTIALLKELTKEK